MTMQLFKVRSQLSCQICWALHVKGFRLNTSTRRFTLTHCLGLLCLLLMWSVLPSRAQTTVSYQKFGAYDGSPDTIDLGTLGQHLEIPLFSKPGRGKGTGLSFMLTNYTGYPFGGVVAPDG